MSVAAGAANAAPNPTAIARSAGDPRGPRGTANAPSATHRARPRVAWHAPVQFRAIATRSNRGNRRRGKSRLVDAASSLTPSRLAHASATASTSGENVVDPGRVDPRSAGSDATRSPSETSAATRSASAATFAAGASVEPTQGWSASFRSRTAARDAPAHAATPPANASGHARGGGDRKPPGSDGDGPPRGSASAVVPARASVADSNAASATARVAAGYPTHVPAIASIRAAPASASRVAAAASARGSPAKSERVARTTERVSVAAAPRRRAPAPTSPGGLPSSARNASHASSAYAARAARCVRGVFERS